jgi:hypothetical protein
MGLQYDIMLPTHSSSRVVAQQSINTSKSAFPASFTLFPKLPLELQHQIWRIACVAQETEIRILPIAPKSHGCQPAIVAKKPCHPCLVPSLLHTCRYSRAMSMKAYTQWPCVDPITYERDGTSIYVKKTRDIFYFRGKDYRDFWYLNSIMNSANTSNEADDIAKHRYVGELNGILHFAFDWELYLSTLGSGRMWLRNFDYMEEMTLVIRNVDGKRIDVDHISRLRSPQPYTITSSCAELILRCAGNHLTELELYYESCGIRMNVPILNVMDANPDASSGESQSDILFLNNLLVYVPSSFAVLATS